ncbi:MAG: M20/M25/M40 family metallo-hydrolase [Kiritimatiellia bacterium]
MDEVGFLVHGISSDGFISVVPVGGWWTHTPLSQRVRILTRSGREVPGVFGATPPHFWRRTRAARSCRSTRSPSTSAPATARRPQARWASRLAIRWPPIPRSPAPVRRPRDGQGLDNRAGMAVAIQAMQELHAAPAASPCDVVAVGTVQEEVGTRGACTMGAHLKPDVILVLRLRRPTTRPARPRANARAVWAGRADPHVRSHRPHESRPREFRRAGRARGGIAHQVAVRRSGGTDASTFQFAGEGVPCVVLGVPVRYIHAHNGILDLRDHESALNLIKAMVRRPDAERVAGFTRYL